MKIEDLEKKISAELESFNSDMAKADSFGSLDNIRTKYLGKKSYLSAMQKSIGTLPNDLKPVVGKNTNLLRQNLEGSLKEKEKILKAAEIDSEMRKESFDLSLPGRIMSSGTKNILSQVLEDIEEIFIGMGFEEVQ